MTQDLDQDLGGIKILLPPKKVKDQMTLKSYLSQILIRYVQNVQNHAHLGY